MIFFRRMVFCSAIFATLSGGLASIVCAQQSAQGSNMVQSAVNTNDDAEKNRQLLESLRQNMRLSKERITALEEEIQSLTKDQQTLSEALIAAADTERRLTDSLHAREQRLENLHLQQQQLREQLYERRGEFAQVLAAIQRMGLNPPPAILVHPEDALHAVRSAKLLGAIVPQMRQTVEEISYNLEALQEVRTQISEQKQQFESELRAQVEEREKLALLIDEKKNLFANSSQALEQERVKIATMVQEATSLEDLIRQLEQQAQGQTIRDLTVPQLTSRTNMENLRHSLSLPVSGRIYASYRGNSTRVDSDGPLGQGVLVETHEDAIVTTPVEGTVIYAGQFRSYGQLLILDAGHGFHIVLAGLERINVEQGQFVLKGEPVGFMGQQQIGTLAALELGNAPPLLYIEFRKDGKPFDPAPWWATDLVGNNTL